MSLSAGVHGYLSWPSLPQKQTFFFTQPHPSLTIILHRQPSRLTPSIMFYTYTGLFTLYYISWMVPVRIFTSIWVLSLPTQCLLFKIYPHLSHPYLPRFYTLQLAFLTYVILEQQDPRPPPALERGEPANVLVFLHSDLDLRVNGGVACYLSSITHGRCPA